MPGIATLHLGLAAIAALQRDRTKVLRLLNTSLTTDRGENLVGSLQQAFLFELFGQLHEAETAFNAAFQIPQNRQVKSLILRRLATIKIKQGDMEAAGYLVAQAWEFADDVDAHVFVESYHSLGDTDRAKTLYEAWQASGREAVHFPWQFDLYTMEEIKSHFAVGNAKAGYTQIRSVIDNRDFIALVDVLNNEFYEPYRNDPEFLEVMTYLEEEKKLAAVDLRPVILPEN